MNRPVPHQVLLLPFTVSIGAAHTTDLPNHDYSALLHAADVAMYQVRPVPRHSRTWPPSRTPRSPRSTAVAPVGAALTPGTGPVTAPSGRRRPRARHLTVVTDTATPAAQPALLDWHDACRFRFDAPCMLCGNLTPLRSHNGEPAHKVCAEAWNAEHPGKARFISDAPRRKRNNIHA
ncbi:GGDEF domain-containing protein [Actinacidiphila glaucinigra]|uniref:hypothetical protein n=1 Tax=Actinacidiphila glaucinigra TaxID=235986 RepID=UPI002DDAEFC6|nr:hypothetical protein [Actinacidiphila glaucinigra]WSD65081.1 GGDEF domain-containing protein [Actinacidiphila glaucinigra]